MGSMTTNLEEMPRGFERAAVFYAELAKAHVGLIVSGGIAPKLEWAVGMGGAKLPNEEELFSLEANVSILMVRILDAEGRLVHSEKVLRLWYVINIGRNTTLLFSTLQG